jgi:hypothetical protein
MANSIDVGKINGNFYGGLPFSADWNFNGGESPSTLSVKVVKSDGDYPNIDNDLGCANTVTVGLGQFNFKGYLMSYDIDKTPQQKVMTLNYTDKSLDLERWYVGLNYRHAPAQNVILVGKQYHPCDTNLDSTVEYQEIQPQVDPCDPCPYMPSDKFKSSCDPIRSEFQIWQVYYTFNDLIGKIPFNVNGAGSVNRKFKSNHTGPLKSVLSAWCSDLGLAYFWDPFSNTLNFVDRTKPLEIPNNLNSTPNIIDYKYGASMANSFARGFLGYFQKQGEIKSYTCSLDKINSFQTLAPLTVADLMNLDNVQNNINQQNQQNAQSTPQTTQTPQLNLNNPPLLENSDNYFSIN